MIKQLRNGISVKSNTKRFAEFTNCNLSQRLFELTLPFIWMMLKNVGFSLTVPRPTSIWGKIFLYSHLSFTVAYSSKSEKDWPVDFAMIDCEPASLTVFTTMCPKEQQTRDNLIVKDHCFIIEIFDKGPVQLIKRVFENSSFIFTVCVKSVPRYHFKLAYVILQTAVKELFETRF